MYQAHSAQRADPERDANRRSLARLRAQIDAIDDNLLDLVERRLAASRAVAALKTGSGGGPLRLRPRREQEVIDRLTRRAAIAPRALVEHLWRELMAFSLQVQVRTELILHGPDAARLEARARRRFGSAAPIRLAASADEALRAAAEREAVAVIAIDDRTDWVDRLPPRLAIFDWIRDEQGEVIAAAVGRIAAEELPDPAASLRPVREAVR